MAVKILCGADIDDYGWLKNQINYTDFIICADSGLRHANAIGITPNIIIGDFDSVSPDMLNSYKDKCDVIHDDNQNATDLMKALGQCPSQADIKIYGARGQRADHDFSTILVLMGMDNPDAVTLCTPYDTRRIIKSNVTINGNIGDKIGIFPLASIDEITVSGLKYAPEVLGGPYDFGWNGACNEMTANTCDISIDSGCALITHSITLS